MADKHIYPAVFDPNEFLRSPFQTFPGVSRKEIPGRYPEYGVAGSNNQPVLVLVSIPMSLWLLGHVLSWFGNAGFLWLSFGR